MAAPVTAAVKDEEAAAAFDMNRAIELTSETIVMVQGKKCVLRVDPSTNHLMAYPFTPGPTPGNEGGMVPLHPGAHPR